MTNKNVKPEHEPEIGWLVAYLTYFSYAVIIAVSCYVHNFITIIVIIFGVDSLVISVTFLGLSQVLRDIRQIRSQEVMQYY